MTLALSATTVWTYNPHGNLRSGEKVLNQQKMNNFLQGVEKRAYRMAYIATQQRDDALDIVQDAMIRLTHKYGHKPESEWSPLFYRILHNRILDWHRRRRGHNRWFSWFTHNEDEEPYALDQHYPDITDNPADRNQGQRAIETLDKALHQLPLRQQQAFLLRAWEGLSVAETAQVMGCSEGSVKTHFSRASNTLKEKLEGQWP